MSRVRIAILQLTMLCLIFLGLAYSSPTVRAETVKPAVPQLQINQTQNVYIDPKYEYALSVPDGWYIYPTPNNVLYGAAVFTNYDVNSLENFHTLPPLGIKIQIGVGPLNKSLAEWANERLTTETAAGSSEPQQLFASRILPIQVGPSLGLVSVIAGPNGYTLAEIILPRGNDEVVSIGITTSEKEGRNAALDLLKTFSVTGMKNFNPDATPISQQIREQIDLLEDEVRIQAPETPLGTCPAGTFPGNEAPSSPITLWMPFQEGQRWVVGGVGSFYGNGYHCNSNNDYYATDWNRSDGASSGSAALPVAGGNIDSSQVTQPPCPNTGYGCKVVVNHGSGIETLYGHLSGISRTSGGVNHWDQIGAVGTTGNSTGAHLHLRFASNGSSHCWNNGANCPNGEAPLSPQSSKPSPMNTQSGAVTLADGTSYVSNNKQDSGGGGPSGYTFCANENQRCNFSGTKDVAYGANGSFNYKYNISDGIDCNNSTFGDPISGVGKACYTKDSSQTGCNPNPDQVALFEHGGYGGNCQVFNKGDYPNPGAMGFPNDTASSVKVGGNVKAILCKDDNYGGCEEFNGDDGNLGDNGIGDNQVSSLKVQDRGSSGGNGVEFCDGTNYGSPCITLTAGKYGNLNDIGWYDRIESLRFKGNYVGNYHVVMSTETGHGGTPGHFEKDEPNLQDPWRNRTRSIEIYYIDRNNPPGTPSLSSPGDWYESNDGTAPNLCWNASSDPEGDNPVQYYTEVFDSAVNGNSGWTTNTCWRPSNLDNQYFGYQWRVKARDNKNKESGWSETRHFTIKQPAPQKPDLRPATLSGYPAPLVPSSTQGTHQTNTLFANARTFIDWHFTNVGNGVASGNFYVDVYFDDQRVVHYPYSDFGAGGTGGFDDWAATFNATGVHKLKIVTDPDNAVQESDENNNVWEQQFIWVAINGWRGEYFKNATLDSNPWLTRDDANIDFDWAGGSPDAALPVDNFSARWTRTAAFECGRYRFNVHVDDGARLWVNNQKILDEWRDQVADFHPEVDLTAGALPIQVEYYEGGGGAAIQVSWQKLSSCVTKPSAPHDPAPANGASLSYRTESDVSVQGEGDKFIFHVWGNNYDRWSDWTSSRSLHLDGLTNQTYNFQAQARNSAGASPWSAVWTFTIQPAPSQQLVLNPGFEVDDDGNGIPDNWGNNVKFMRVGTPRRSDSYAGRLSATDNKNVTITQQISNLSAGQTYNASCWVRIKKTADVFAFKVQVRWRDSANKILRTDVIGRTFTGKTVGWEQAARTMSAPTGTATAQFQFKATSLNAKIYLDDCSFTP